MAGITIKEIAKLAGVSHTTVSRSLNNNTLICEGTRNAIKELARKHGYVPNCFAKSLVTRKSFNIDLFFSSIGSNVTESFFYKTSTGIQKIIKEKYNLIIRGIDDFNGSFSAITGRSFDGILLVSQNHKDDSFIKYLIERKIPVVVINRNMVEFNVDCFFSDEKEIIKKTVIYLLKKGHRRIGFLKGAPDSISAGERYSGYVESVSEKLGHVSNDLIFDGDYTVKSGYIAGTKIIKAKPVPSAVICSNDNMAIGLMKFLNENKLRVPDDISVTGFDNTEISEFLLPPLTTIERPVDRIIKAASERLIRKLEDKECPDKTVIKCLKSELIIRQSAARKGA